MESISQWWSRLSQGRLPMTYRIFISSIFLLILLTSFAFKGTQIAHAAVPPAIIPGGSWTDTSGNSIQAHGEGMIKVGFIYYWFGEDRSQNNAAFININCYSSIDLVHWTFRGHALTQQASGDLGPNRVVERPKVIYNALTHFYVMYVHIDSSNYGEAKVGVATSRIPWGPYTYRGSYNPLGNQSRDMTVFQDTDGSAYLIYSTNNNMDMKIDKLSADYLSDTGTVYTFSGVRWEAPGMFKVNGRYYLIISSPTGWAPNPNMYTSATSLAGAWATTTSLAPDSPNTYDSQDAYILPVTGLGGTTYIYMGDRWDANTLGNSRYIWLPLQFNGTSISLSNYDAWTMNIFTGTWRAIPTTAYEAESSANTLSGGARIMNCSNCSGGQDVGYLGNNSGTMQFNNVTAPCNGNFLLTIYYANGDATARTAMISINGGAATTYTFATSHGGNLVATLPITVSLNSGSRNTIEFFNTSSWAPDIDKITITTK